MGNASSIVSAIPKNAAVYSMVGAAAFQVAPYIPTIAKGAWSGICYASSGVANLITGSPPEQPRQIDERVLEERLRSQLGRAAANLIELRNEAERTRAELQLHEAKTESEQQRLAELKSKADKLDDQLRVKQAELECHKSTRHESKTEADLRALRRLAHESIGIDMVSKVNIAVVGQRGVGKSTTINGLRRLTAIDEGAAEVDVNESTMEIQQYPHPLANHIVLWDMPGSCTLNHTGDTYFLEKFLYGFDYLLVMFTNNLGEAEIDLIKQAIAYRVPYAVVRNKANVDLNALRRDKREFAAMSKEEGKEKLIQMHRQKIVETLRQAGISTEGTTSFIINAYAFVDDDEVSFEEHKLIEHLMQEIVGARYQQHPAVASNSVRGQIIDEDEEAMTDFKRWVKDW